MDHSELTTRFAGLTTAHIADGCIRAGVEVRPHLEIRNKLGQPVHAQELVLTIEDDHGQTKGLSAKPHKGDGHYSFSYAFPHAGHYTLRVFPPSVDSSFEIPLDVE